ncbi:hypothetical protein FUAX_26880 [Fulvitalea axinellae]|uniref:7,8-dihydroneopterin aldolase n=1 Tax=Fulvitalea axinellae TaxID=1182444 RepID=A0AAU9DB31_9BACT|nr:hypothetical protein FUAX_26880 [Fulvitalea axinellae]
MGKICLEGLEFFAYHGYFEEERKIGNKYGVDIVVDTDFDYGAKHDDLDGTVNYMVLYDIIKEEMSMPSKLLENVGKRIIERVFSRFATAKNVCLSIAKFNPPIGGICSRAKIVIDEERPKPEERTKNDRKPEKAVNEHYGLPDLPEEKDIKVPEEAKSSGYSMLEELCE